MPEDHVHHAPLIDQQTPPRPRAVRPRHAASLIVYRGDGDDLSMLMGMRGAKHRFMPNRLVFPGGAVDRADLDAPSATPLSPHTEHLLRKSANASAWRTAWASRPRANCTRRPASLSATPPQLHGCTCWRAPSRRHPARSASTRASSWWMRAMSPARWVATANWRACATTRCRRRWRSIWPCRRGACWSGCGVWLATGETERDSADPYAGDAPRPRLADGVIQRSRRDQAARHISPSRCTLPSVSSFKRCASTLRSAARRRRGCTCEYSVSIST